MKKRISLCVPIALLLITVFGSFSEGDWLENILAKLEDYRAGYPQEKVHIHTDKPYYSIGDDIWLKAYVVNNENHELSILSKVLYVDLVNDHDSVCKTAVVPLANGLGNTNITLTDSIVKAGNYTIRAYTRWMQNFDSDYFFRKNIIIGDARVADLTIEASAEPGREDSLKADIQFFPEGGWLVNGLRSKVGVKATFANGKGIVVSGIIVNSKNRKLTGFTTQHAGMGLFALRPASGETYTAIITDEHGNVTRHTIPSALAEGCVMAVTHADTGGVIVRLAATKSLLNKEYGLVAQQNGCLRYASKLSLDKPALNTRIASNRFNTGIVQFTVLSADGVPLAERLIFIDHHDQLQVDIKTPQDQYTPREKVELDLAVNDNAAAPQQANLSVAVTDESVVAVDDNTELSIEANFLMVSDLKGYIEKPNYYFINPTPEKVQQLDNLLLTQGWRRFTWEAINSGTMKPLVYKAQKSIGVSGSIVDGTNKPIPYGEISLLAKTTQGPLLLDTIADKDGHFAIDQLDVDGDFKALVKPKSKKKNIKVILDRPVKAKYSNNQADVEKPDARFLLSYLSSTRNNADAFNDSILNGSKLLKEVSIKGKKVRKSKTIPGSFKTTTGEADLVLTYDDLKWRPNVLQSMYGHAGIEVKDQKVYMMRGPRSIVGGKRPMEIRVNGSPVIPEYLGQLSSDDVEGVELIMSSYNLVVYGDSGSSGVIEVTLKNSNSLSRLSKNDPVGNGDQQLINGYNVSREFYSPAYDAADLNKSTPDTRSTIYWNPNVVSDEAGKAKVNFFTADKPGTYRVVIEGINIEGRLARQVYRFVVKQQ